MQLEVRTEGVPGKAEVRLSISYTSAASNSPLMLPALKPNDFMYVADYLPPFESDIHVGPVSCDQEVLGHIVLMCLREDTHE